MKAIFLDKATFGIKLATPTMLTSLDCYDATEQDDALIIERCLQADIIITNKVQINAHVLANLPKLKLIQVTATGINNVDVDACRAQGVVLYNVEGYSSQSVAEHTFMLMLSAMRAGLYYHEQVANGKWQRDGRFCLVDMPILDLAGRTLGIIGAGTIGRQVGKLAGAFGMKVLYAEHQGRSPRNDEYTDFDEVLACADIISLHCPLTEKTHHLIGEKNLAKMSKRPLLINVARGAVVDSQALVQALQEDRILGYASDVFECEPPKPDDALLRLCNHPRVIFSPHNAWASQNAQHKLWQIACGQIDEFICQQNTK